MTHSSQSEVSLRDKLGAPRLGDVAFETYRANTEDEPPDLLIDLYASARATLRARPAIAHLEDEHRPDAEKWRARTMRYLYIAADHASKLE